MKSLINLILLAALGVGGIYAYAEYKQDEELKAKLNYYASNIVYIVQEEYRNWRDDARDGVDEARREAGDIKRSARQILQ